MTPEGTPVKPRRRDGQSHAWSMLRSAKAKAVYYLMNWPIHAYIFIIILLKIFLYPLAASRRIETLGNDFIPRKCWYHSVIDQGATIVKVQVYLMLRHSNNRDDKDNTHPIIDIHESPLEWFAVSKHSLGTTLFARRIGAAFALVDFGSWSRCLSCKTYP
ncbi:hypothetical protein ARMGADRAFT_1069469 [Armillaria gallica]|uniref:Uncharacterized protein n=1 Tax=Armillaria gallica TaxID=47427 RepID=A0A2H3CDF2_ARMGA|nr:hypothetical protein ARMGADRAFT_1069469 [Armillaria gallica]